MGMRCQVQLLLDCSSLCAGFALQQSTDASSVKNPIRMVVTMLQKMQKRVEEEGEAEKKLYDKFMCYCKSGGKELDASISGAENKVSTLPAEITAAEEKLVQLKDDIKEHQADRAGAKAALAKATALRNKEAAEFAKLKAEADSNLLAVAKAITALENGIGAGFLQTRAAQDLRTFVMNKADVEDVDRQVLVSFLSGNSGDASPGTGPVIGMLKQMEKSMESVLSEGVKEEESAISAYQKLVASKTQEVEVLTALSETIKTLNDDDALDLFKKTLPSGSSSLVQVQQSRAVLREKALRLVRKAWRVADGHHRPRLDFLVLALTGKKALSQGTFDKVIKLCDSMVAELKQEQQDDYNKKSLERKDKEADNAMAKAKEAIETLSDEISA